MALTPHRSLRTAVVAVVSLLPAVALLLVPIGALAAQAPVGLGTAGSFAVLAGTTVTNTGPTVLVGDLGLEPGTSVTGGPVVTGSTHVHDAVAAQAQHDLVTAFDDAAGRAPATAVAGDLVGRTLAPGVYRSTSSLGLTGTVTLDAAGDPQAVFVFQIASTLVTGTQSRVAIINGGQACNVFWQVGSSATLGTGSQFKGSILALTSIAAQTAATAEGRLLARNGAVTLDSNTITRPGCTTPGPTPSGTVVPGPTVSTTPSATPTGSGTPAPVPTVSPSGSGSPSGSPTAVPTLSPTLSPSAVPTASPTGAPSPSVLPSSVTSPPAGGTLPSTGPRVPLAAIVSLAAGALLLGIVLLALTRRRSARR
jgi:hypothetical protein